MELKTIHDAEKNRFSIFIENEEAYLAYRIQPGGVLEFYSTYVPDSGRGKGTARRLVDAGVEFAKSVNMKIKPSCSYVEKYFEKSPELSSLLAK